MLFDLSNFQQSVNWWLGIPAVLLGIPTAWATFVSTRRNLKASKLVRPGVFELPQIPNADWIYKTDIPDLRTYIAGRNEDINSFSKLIRDSSLVFLYGASGVGKSTFLKLGLGRALYQSGQWLPIYVDSWGRDWIDGPWLALVDAVSLAIRNCSNSNKELDPVPLVGRATVFEALNTIRAKTGRRPVLLFDQVDDYLERFHEFLIDPETKSLLNSDEVCKKNSFWHSVASLCRDNNDPVHCLFSTKPDSGELNAFRFIELKVRHLNNISAPAAKDLIQALVPEEAVKNPENGFTELIDRVVEELGEERRDILPIQLRTALAGIGILDGKLTPKRLVQAGGVHGLAAKLLDRQIRSTELGMPSGLAVLLRMVEHTETSLRTVWQPLQKLLEVNAAKRVTQRDLTELESRQVIRGRLRGTDSEEWQLYHDYLAQAVLALERRSQPWQTMLNNAHLQYRHATTFYEKWKGLLSPKTQILIFWNWLRRRIRYGEHAGFARLSLVRLFINPLVIGLAALYLIKGILNLGGEALEVSNQFDNTPDLTYEEAQACWRIARTSDRQLGIRVLSNLLLSSPDRQRFLSDSQYILTAVAGLHQQNREQLKSFFNLFNPLSRCGLAGEVGSCSVLAEFIDDPKISEAVVGRLLGAMGKAGSQAEISSYSQLLIALLREIEADKLKPVWQQILTHLENETNSSKISAYADVLVSLPEEVRGQYAGKAADLILKQVERESDTNKLPALENSLIVFAPVVKTDVGFKAFGQIFNRLEREQDPNNLSKLGDTLNSLSGVVEPKYTSFVAQQVNSSLERQQESIKAAWLGNALARLTKGKNSNYTSQTAQRILARLNKEQNSTAIILLGGALASLSINSKENFADRGAQGIVARLRTEQNVNRVDSLASALASLATVRKQQYALTGAVQILSKLEREQDPSSALTLASALATLSVHAKGDYASKGIQEILLRLPEYEMALQLQLVNTALASLAQVIDTNSITPLTQQLLTRIQKSKSTLQTSVLASTVAILATKAQGDWGNKAFDGVIRQLGDEQDSNLVLVLHDSVIALATQVSSSEAPKFICDILTRLKKEQNPIKVSIFGETLGRLAGKEQLPLLIDLLKWPVITQSGRNQIIRRILQIKGVNSQQFNKLPSSKFFNVHLWRFVAWASQQTDLNGRHFDLDGPPLGPAYFSEHFYKACVLHRKLTS